MFIKALRGQHKLYCPSVLSHTESRERDVFLLSEKNVACLVVESTPYRNPL